MCVIDNSIYIFLQQKRPLKDLKGVEIAFVAISVVSSLVAIVLAIQRLATTSNGDPDFTFALIIIINTCKSETQLMKRMYIYIFIYHRLMRFHRFFQLNDNDRTFSYHDITYVILES